MDLFTSNMTDNQKLNDLKEKYKNLLEVEQNGKGKFNITKGSKQNYGNCVMIILPNVTDSGFMNADYETQTLMCILDEYEIVNYIICYAQPSKVHSASRKEVKKSRPLMYELIDIVQPKFIVVCGEVSAELFMTQKPNIITSHGTLVCSYSNIPVVLTYNPDYYVTRTGYEDDTYKTSILTEDWTLISDTYKNLIKE